MVETKEVRIRMIFDEEVLGLSPADPEIYRAYIASKAPDKAKIEDEVAEFGVDEMVERGLTVFPVTRFDGMSGDVAYMYDYQIKGMFKDCCSMLWRVKNSESKKLKAYKKIIDGLIFIKERRIPFMLDGRGVTDADMGVCERPLRAATPMGERVAIAASKTVPAGSSIEFTVQLLDPDHEKVLFEWLDYGCRRGFGQWRNSGKGRYHWEEIQ